MNKLILVIFVAMTISCCRIDDNIIGKYNSYRHEKGVVHYVELFPDSTYEHVYIQNGNKKINKGVWLLRWKDSSRIFIDFHGWENFGYTKDYCLIYNRNDINGYGVFIKNKRMFFDIDDYDKNFMKE